MLGVVGYIPTCRGMHLQCHKEQWHKFMPLLIAVAHILAHALWCGAKYSDSGKMSIPHFSQYAGGGGQIWRREDTLAGNQSTCLDDPASSCSSAWSWSMQRVWFFCRHFFFFYTRNSWYQILASCCKFPAQYMVAHAPCAVCGACKLHVHTHLGMPMKATEYRTVLKDFHTK